MSLQAQIKEHALNAGFDLAGIAPVAAWQDLEFAQTWNERGYGGEMLYLKNPRRGDPHLILPSVKSILCVGLVYNTPLPYSTETNCQSSVVSRQLPGSLRREASSQPAAATHEFQTPPALSGVEGRTARSEPSRTAPSAEPRAWISRYAWGRDYHRVMRIRLERLRAAIEQLAPGVETRVYVDTGPLLERAFARLSGIGWTGKNTCLINQQRGSWFFIGVILTSLELEPDGPAFDRCGSCRRCLDACPTGALVEPYVMDASRCIAYFNIELKGSIPAQFRPAIGANVFGCDICQDVCPWNGPGEEFEDRNSKIETRKLRPRVTTELPEFYPLTIERPVPTRRASLENANHASDGNGQRTPDSGPQTSNSGQRPFSLFHPRLEDLASLSEDDFRRLFRDSPINRVKYRGWLRNLCVAMGNCGDRRFVAWLETMRLHADAVVREHAEWAIHKLAQQENGDVAARGSAPYTAG
ncbi:MAG TPA: tRNA epoxyqueuosine(34) reductase QueG [Terriglobia bacterium]|nr:tRNA epoxyqueuosine(34) reductase QueG [Terriglobia bacterium]